MCSIVSWSVSEERWKSILNRISIDNWGHQNFVKLQVTPNKVELRSTEMDWGKYYHNTLSSFHGNKKNIIIVNLNTPLSLLMCDIYNFFLCIQTTIFTNSHLHQYLSLLLSFNNLVMAQECCYVLVLVKIYNFIYRNIITVHNLQIYQFTKCLT